MKTSLLVVLFCYVFPPIISTFMSTFAIGKSTSAIVMIAEALACLSTMVKILSCSGVCDTAFPIPLAIRTSVVPANPVIDSDQDAN